MRAAVWQMNHSHPRDPTCRRCWPHLPACCAATPAGELPVLLAVESQRGRRLSVLAEPSVLNTLRSHRLHELQSTGAGAAWHPHMRSTCHGYMLQFFINAASCMSCSESLQRCISCTKLQALSGAVFSCVVSAHPASCPPPAPEDITQSLHRPAVLAPTYKHISIRPLLSIVPLR